jgi:hypothetical protein
MEIVATILLLALWALLHHERRKAPRRPERVEDT